MILDSDMKFLQSCLWFYSSVNDVLYYVCQFTPISVNSKITKRYILLTIDTPRGDKQAGSNSIISDWD